MTTWISSTSRQKYSEKVEALSLTTSEAEVVWNIKICNYKYAKPTVSLFRLHSLLLKLPAFSAMDGGITEELFFAGLIGNVRIDSIIPYILKMETGEYNGADAENNSGGGDDAASRETLVLDEGESPAKVYVFENADGEVVPAVSDGDIMWRGSCLGGVCPKIRAYYRAGHNDRSVRIWVVKIRVELWEMIIASTEIIVPCRKWELWFR